MSSILTLLFDLFIFIIIFLIFEFLLYLILKKATLKRIAKEYNIKKNDKGLEMDQFQMIIGKNKLFFGNLQDKLKNEEKMPHLNKITMKRTFEKRVPLPKEIKCKPHFIYEELPYFW